MRIFSAVALALPLQASACVALDYQEMKDMSIEELVAAACKARSLAVAALDDGISSTGRNRGHGAHTATSTQATCSGQIVRIERVLAMKGSPKMRIVDRCKLPPSASVPKDGAELDRATDSDV